MPKHPSAPVDPYVSRVLEAVKRGPGQSAKQIATEIHSNQDRVTPVLAAHAASAATGYNGAKAWYLKGTVPKAEKGKDVPIRTHETVSREARADARANHARLEMKALGSRLVSLEDAVNFMHRAPSAPPKIETPRSRPKSGLRTATPMFLLSDLHFGESVTLAESLGQNEYNLEIAATRMRKCWDNMLWLRKDMARTQSCDDTYVGLNGDIISGDIHPELQQTNDGGILDQADAAFAALYPGLVEMANDTPGKMHVVCIGGNHGRLTHKQQIKNGTQHSAEHLGVYGPLRKVLGAGKKGNIVWHIPASERYIFDVHGRRVSQQHGTMIRSQGGIGGTLVPMTRWVTRTADADLFLFGHFHEADAYGRIIKNGALIGESGYTKWLGVESRPPEQVAFVIDATAGVRRFERVSVI